MFRYKNNYNIWLSMCSLPKTSRISYKHKLRTQSINGVIKS